jgi:hypothetical protein
LATKFNKQCAGIETTLSSMTLKDHESMIAGVIEGAYGDILASRVQAFVGKAQSNPVAPNLIACRT